MGSLSFLKSLRISCFCSDVGANSSSLNLEISSRKLWQMATENVQWQCQSKRKIFIKNLTYISNSKFYVIHFSTKTGQITYLCFCLISRNFSMLIMYKALLMSSAFNNKPYKASSSSKSCLVFLVSRLVCAPSPSLSHTTISTSMIFLGAVTEPH